MQLKLTLVLFFVGLMSACTVGGIAYWAVMNDFRASVMEQAFKNFREDINDYLEAYGGWEEASQAERFEDFVFHKRRRWPPPGPEDHPGFEGEEPHAGGRLARSGPPFVFMVMDPKGVVVISRERQQIGTVAPDRVMKIGRPIYYNDDIVLYASPVGQPRLTAQDMSYLKAMRQSLVTGITVALMLAVLLGLLFGRTLTVTLKKLTQAIKSMQQEREKEQFVPVTTRDELGQLAQAFNSMSSELSKAHKELRELSIHDGLTGLYNRRHFDVQVTMLFEQASRYHQPLTVMIGDLDHFKGINDSFGHEVGDRVLEAVGHLLSSHTRKSDVVARYGGEEFVICFPNSAIDQAVTCCEKIRGGVESHSWEKIHPDLRVTMSMGVCADMTVSGVEKMISIADHNLYMAKKRGRNRVVSGVAN